MDYSAAVATIQTLDALDVLRRRALIDQALRITDPDELRRHVYRARAEQAEVQDANAEALEALWRDRDAMDAQRQVPATVGPEKGVQPRSIWVDGSVPLPKVRPVVVTWTTPRKPDLVREPKRPEGVGANRVYAEPKPKRERIEPEHGTTRRYAAPYKCRCPECKTAKSVENRQYAARVRARVRTPQDVEKQS
jgi:hypothetical protein